MAKRIHTYFSKFTEHPHSLGESYITHLVCALKYGTRMIVTGFAVIIHAIFPFVFKDSGSRLAKSICDDVDKRSSN